LSILSEHMTTYYTKKWAEMYGLDIKYANEAIRLITELAMETDYDYDLIEAVVLSSYPLNPPETILEKFERGKKSQDAGQLVKWCRY